MTKWDGTSFQIAYVTKDEAKRLVEMMTALVVRPKPEGDGPLWSVHVLTKRFDPSAKSANIRGGGER